MAKSTRYKKFLFIFIPTGLVILLWGSYLSGFSLFSRIQYQIVTADMNSVEATVVDVEGEWRKFESGRLSHSIDVTYEVEGKTYHQTLEIIVQRMIKVREDYEYSVGDKITIYYEPGNPEKVEYPNSEWRELTYDLICICVLVIGTGIVTSLERYHSSSRSKRSKEN